MHSSAATRAHVRTPSALLYRDKARSPEAVWQVLDDICREDTSIRMTASALAAACGIALATLKRYVTALVEEGWLRITGTRGRHGSTVWEPLRRARPTTPTRTPSDGAAAAERVTKARASNGSKPRSQARPNGSAVSHPGQAKWLRTEPIGTGPSKDRAREEKNPRMPVGFRDLVAACVGQPLADDPSL